MSSLNFLLPRQRNCPRFSTSSSLDIPIPLSDTSRVPRPCRREPSPLTRRPPHPPRALAACALSPAHRTRSTPTPAKTLLVPCTMLSTRSAATTASLRGTSASETRGPHRSPSTTDDSGPPTIDSSRRCCASNDSLPNWTAHRHLSRSSLGLLLLLRRKGPLVVLHIIGTTMSGRLRFEVGATCEALLHGAMVPGP